MLSQSIYTAAYPLPRLSRDQIDALKQAVDLREEIERDLGPGQRSGRWRKYHSPFRDDRRPSFGVSEGIYIDFGTSQRGDILTWLQETRNLNFREALAYLIERTSTNGYTDFAGSYFPQRRPSASAASDATKHSAPSAAWQQAALHELEQAEHYLWSSAGARALAYLREARGLTDETIRHFRLGYNPAWKRTDHRRSDTGKPAHLAPGIVIPWFVGGDLWALKVRCRVGNLADCLDIEPDAFVDWKTGKREELDKYLNLADGNQAATLFNADALSTDKPVLIVEGEFDAMLTWQHTHEQIAAVTLGSASYELPAHWRERLASVPLVLSALDDDRAGQEASHKLKAALGSELRCVRLPVGKDLTEFVVEYRGDARLWVEQALVADTQEVVGADLPTGLPDAIRQASLRFLTGAVTLVAELWWQAAGRKLLAADQPFTIQQLYSCGDKLGWGVKASTITEGMATDDAAGGVFFEKLDPETPPDSCVGEDQGSNKPKKAGRPAARYRARSMQAVVEALAQHAYFRLTEKHFPAGGQALAEVTVAWFTALGFEQAEAERLTASARERFAGVGVDAHAEAALRRDLSRVRRALQQVLDGQATCTPLPEAWGYSSPVQYRAAFLRGLAEAEPNQRRSRRDLARSIGVSEASVTVYLDRAGLENVEQFEERWLDEGELALQVKQAERRCQGHAQRLISRSGDASAEFVFAWDRLPQAERWVKAQQAAGASLTVRVQVASVQRLVMVEPGPGSSADGRQVAGDTTHRSGASRQRNSASQQSTEEHKQDTLDETSGAAVRRHRHFVGAMFDPAWVTEQVLLGLALSSGQVYRPGRVYHAQIGEVIWAGDIGAWRLADKLGGPTSGLAVSQAVVAVRADQAA